MTDKQTINRTDSSSSSRSSIFSIVPRYVNIYIVFLVVFLVTQLLMLDTYIVMNITGALLVLLLPFDFLICVLIGLVIRNSVRVLAPIPRTVTKISEIKKSLFEGNSNSLLSVTWACYLCNLSLKIFMLFPYAKSMSVLDFLGPNILINTIRLTPVLFFLFYTIATHRAPLIQTWLLPKMKTLSDGHLYVATSGEETKQLTLNIALDLLDATELYYFFSYFSASHGLSTGYNQTPFTLPLTNVSVSTPFQMFLNTTSGFIPVASPLIADLVSPINLTDLFPHSSDVCRPISNVAEIHSIWLTKLMIVATAMAGLSSMYAMFTFESHFQPVKILDDSALPDSEQISATKIAARVQRTDRFQWYKALTFGCVNLPAFMLRFLLWASFGVSISPMIVKNLVSILIFLQF